MDKTAGDFCQPSLLSGDDHFAFHRVKYVSLTSWRAKMRVGAEFQFHLISGAAGIAEVESIGQQLKQALSPGSVFILLFQGLSQRGRVVDKPLEVQFFLFCSERLAIYANWEFQIAV